MGVLTVFSAKGGCGASLIATNLALALAHSAPTLLLDLHGQEGTDDLLLDLRSPHAWPELLPVAAELTDRHIELVGCRHPGGSRTAGGTRLRNRSGAGTGHSVAPAKHWPDATHGSLSTRRRAPGARHRPS